jgi:hypothetical protein
MVVSAAIASGCRNRMLKSSANTVSGASSDGTELAPSVQASAICHRICISYIEGFFLGVMALYLDRYFYGVGPSMRTRIKDDFRLHDNVHANGAFGREMTGLCAGPP